MIQPVKSGKIDGNVPLATNDSPAGVLTPFLCMDGLDALAVDDNHRMEWPRVPWLHNRASGRHHGWFRPRNGASACGTTNRQSAMDQNEPATFLIRTLSGQDSAAH